MAFFSLNGDKKKDGGLDAFGQGIGLKYNGFGEVPFSIAHSFLFDGIDEYFSIPTLDLSTILSGTNNPWSITFLILPLSVTSTNYIFDNGKVRIRQQSNGRLWIRFVDAGVNKTSEAIGIFMTNGVWKYITVSYDPSQSAGSMLTVYHNGVTATMASDSATNNIDVPVVPNRVGINISSVSPLNGNVAMISFRDEPTTSGEDTIAYNGGTPLNPDDLYGSNSVRNWIADNSTDTAQFTWTDTKGSDATSVNMEDADKTTTTPY